MRHTVFCVLSVLITIVLALVSLRYVTDFWLLSFVYSFQLHLSLICAVGAVIALFFKRHWYGFLMLAVATFLNIHGIIMLHEFAGRTPTEGAPRLFRLMSFNIENDNFENGERIADAILASGADVVDIMEAEPVFAQLQRLQQLYPYRIGCDASATCDTLVLSKRPFGRQEIRDIGELWKQRLVSASIDFDGMPVDFLFPHLSKPYFDDFQADELQDLAALTQVHTGALVVAGDFNSSILAPTIQHFLRGTGLSTAFPEPTTWPVAAGPFGISIDHIFARLPLLIRSTSRLDDSFGSNHYGLVSDFVRQ
ncbi:endonuclease/exonuclease/phosphatase (EEP) superfamily protein YafD [Rhizobium sp. BK650]|uniref:endonuclease/exonuclease/phosphatase family protein n=1 Tax=Rhizobium sp. BK650 TaxID=2586990 RepID=UPI0016165836|nr:endonuclease/exonuclease/phosphatase family protein [Rhizobium sp. BK650]MBB3655181.1 endonuclease/exonuclease/phosphatase (EEP) superfamily protein YafD [Rhizobium sp. BK650]